MLRSSLRDISATAPPGRCQVSAAGWDGLTVTTLQIILINNWNTSCLLYLHLSVCKSIPALTPRLLPANLTRVTSACCSLISDFTALISVYLLCNIYWHFVDCRLQIVDHRQAFGDHDCVMMLRLDGIKDTLHANVEQVQHIRTNYSRFPSNIKARNGNQEMICPGNGFVAFNGCSGSS